MLTMYFFNVGHGDSIAVKFPNNDWGIIDCNRNSDTVEPNVLVFLKAIKVNRLKFICITHPHEDHFDGMDEIVDYFGKNIDLFLIFGRRTGHSNEERESSLTNALKIFIETHKETFLDKIIYPERGSKIIIDNIEITFLNPTANIIKKLSNLKYLTNQDFNNESIVLNFIYNNNNILLTGDSTKANWSEILKDPSLNNNLMSQITKISHHGSAQSNNKEIFDHIISKEKNVSIISTDGGILYKSIPSAEIINCLEKNCNSTLLRTDSLNIITKNQENEPLLEQDNIDLTTIETISNFAQGDNYNGLIKIIIDDDGIIHFFKIDTLEEEIDNINKNKI